MKINVSLDVEDIRVIGLSFMAYEFLVKNYGRKDMINELLSVINDTDLKDIERMNKLDNKLLSEKEKKICSQCAMPCISGDKCHFIPKEKEENEIL